MKFLKRVAALALTAVILVGGTGCSKSHKAFSISDIESVSVSRGAVEYSDVAYFSSDIMSPKKLDGKPASIHSEEMNAQSLYNVAVDRFHMLPAVEVKEAFYICTWQKDDGGQYADTEAYLLVFNDTKTAEKLFGALEVQQITGWPDGKYASGNKGYYYSTVCYDTNTGKYERGIYRAKNTLLYVKGVCKYGTEDALVAEVCDKLGVVSPMKAK